MPILTDQDFANAKVDIKDIGESTNEKKIIKPRYGNSYKSIPMIAEEFNNKTVAADAVINEIREAVNQVSIDSLPAMAVSTATGSNQQIVNDLGGVDYYPKNPRAYPLNGEVRLGNGDIVKSIVANNIKNPNLDMTGWVKINSASQIIDSSGQTQQQVNDKFRLWFASIEDFGADVNKTAIENSNAINNALQNAMHVYFPHGKTYQIDFDIISARSNQLLYGGSVLQGQQTQTAGADGRGVFLKMQDIDNTTVDGITIRNGFRGRGIECTNSRNIKFKDVILDGFTYCMWVGEQRLSDTDVRGCQNVWIENCSFLSARYWNLYIRCASVVDEQYKTQRIWITNPYVYNASMAGIVLAEGHVKNVVIENPYFKRCNVCMHFEFATDITVINPRDEDTAKKPDHQAPNTEYPYVGWSMYTAFAHRIKIKGGQMTATCYHFGTVERPSSYIEYESFTGFDFVYEAGTTQDTAKNVFKNYTFNNVTATSRLGWQNSGASHYLRDFTFINCKSDGGAGRNAMNFPRTVNLKVIDCYMVNSFVTIGNEGYSQFTGNTVVTSTAVVNTFNGTDLTSIFDFKDNTFISGATNVGDRVFTIQNFGVVNYDNTVDANAQYSAVVSNVTALTWGLSPHLKLRATTPYSVTNVASIIDARRPMEVTGWTSANLGSATSVVNTTGKYVGKEVYNSTTAKFMKSLGSIPTSGWAQMDDNTIIITPA